MAALRHIGAPLAEIKVIVGLEPGAAAKQVAAYWSDIERDHEARRLLAEHLVARLSGKRSVMYEITTREIPARSVLSVKRNVEGEQGAWAFGKEFVGIFKQRPLPAMKGIAGATFCIYYGQVSDDSDGPLEWCRPVPADRAEEIATQYPELGLRTEPAHTEAFVHLGPGGQTSAVEWQLVSESLRTWAGEHDRRPSELGVRITYMVTPPRTAQSVPDCDFAVPLR